MEEALLLAVQSFSNPYLDIFMLSVSFTGLFWVWLIVSVFLLFKNRRLSKSLLLGVPITALFTFLLKQLIARPRPYEVLDIRILEHASSASFPSGHAAIAFFVAYNLSRCYPKYKAGFYAWAALVGLSRIYLGMHYLTDVIAGAALGFTFGIFLSRLHLKA